LGSRVANALVSYVAYLGQLFYPAGLAALYPHPQNALPLGKIVGCGLLLAGLSLTILARRRKCPYLLVGWLWYLGMLVPVIGLVQVGAQAMADRYTYVSQIGLCIALAWAVGHITSAWRYRGWACGIGAASVLAVLMGCAWQQTHCWHDSKTLWTHALACTSGNAIAHAKLGNALAGRGQVDKAIAHYRKALEIKPDFADAQNNLGAALAGRGRVDEAITHYRKAVEIKPDLAKAHYNLALALADHGRPDEAIDHFQKALGLATAQNDTPLAQLIRAQIGRHQPAPSGNTQKEK
jgi:tetratricopeptide (TPR) repeat protein